MTNQEIIATGQTIANETHIGGNTAERVGSVIEGIGENLDTIFSKLPTSDTVVSYGFSDFTDGKFFNTNQSVGTTIPAVSSNASFAYLLLNCSVGQKFHIVGVGGNSARLWCFVDARNKKISSSDAGAGNTTTGIDIVAPANAAQVYIQISKSSTPNYSTVVSVEKITTELSSQTILEYIEDMLDDYDEETVQPLISRIVELENKFPHKTSNYSFSDFRDGYFYNTSLSVGTIIGTGSSNSGFASLVLNCEEGDAFHIVGIGGGSARLWCFVDSSNKKISSSDADAGNINSGVDIVAPSNAAQVYIQISKGQTTNYSTVVKVEKTLNETYTLEEYVQLAISGLQSSLEDYIDTSVEETVQPLANQITEIESKFPHELSNYSFADFTDGEFFNTSLSVGAIISTTSSSNASFAYLILDCSEGQNFHIVGVGGSSARLWCFVDSNNRKISSSDAGAGNNTTGIDVTAPANAVKVYIQINKSGTPNYNTVVSVETASQEIGSIEEYVESVANELQSSLEDYVDTTINRVRNIKILAIGNSYSINAMCYIPWILDNIAPEVDYTFGIWLYGGASLEHHYDIISNNTTGNNYIKMKKGDTKWNTATGGSTISALMADEDWDIVTLQQASAYHADYSTYQPYLNDIVKSLFGYAQRSIRFGWLFTPSKQTTLNVSVTDYENIAACVQRVMNETAVDFIIPAGTALQNARTVPALQALGDSGNMTYDQHLQGGIPCLVEAYAYALSVLREMGMNYRSMYGDSFTPDSTWETNTGMTSMMYGSPVGLTDANRMAAQICAIQALKKPYEITDCASIV